jgi:hypothetical protein
MRVETVIVRLKSTRYKIEPWFDLYPVLKEDTFVAGVYATADARYTSGTSIDKFREVLLSDLVRCAQDQATGRP